MPGPRFTLEDAKAICVAPFLERERRAEQAREADRMAQAARAQGVSWSGLGPTPGPPRRGSGEILSAAQAAAARAAAFAAGPRGRFLASLQILQALGHAGPAEAARAAFARGFADPDAPACAAEIGCALSALARLPAPAARTACLALSEILATSLGLAAE